MMMVMIIPFMIHIVSLEVDLRRFSDLEDERWRGLIWLVRFVTDGKLIE